MDGCVSSVRASLGGICAPCVRARKYTHPSLLIDTSSPPPQLSSWTFESPVIRGRRRPSSSRRAPPSPFSACCLRGCLLVSMGENPELTRSIVHAPFTISITSWEARYLWTHGIAARTWDKVNPSHEGEHKAALSLAFAWLTSPLLISITANRSLQGGHQSAPRPCVTDTPIPRPQQLMNERTNASRSTNRSTAPACPARTAASPSPSAASSPHSPCPRPCPASAAALAGPASAPSPIGAPRAPRRNATRTWPAAKPGTGCVSDCVKAVISSQRRTVRRRLLLLLLTVQSSLIGATGHFRFLRGAQAHGAGTSKCPRRLVSTRLMECCVCFILFCWACAYAWMAVQTPSTP